MYEDRFAALAERVLAVRLGQMVINEHNKAGAFRVPIHLALGHEAIAVAVSDAMQDGDQLLLTHRNVHYNLARNPRLAEKVREFALDPTGGAGGQLGCMNYSDASVGIPYTSSILANNLSVAPGVALGQSILGRRVATFVVTGDGAIEEGAFYESLLMGRSVAASMVVVIENNGWSLATRIEERRAPIDLQKMAGALDIPFQRLRGNDPLKYAKHISALRDEAIEARTPVLLEVCVNTLGDWMQETPEHPDGKLINYHAGIAPTVELEKGPLLAKDPSDPVFVLMQRYSAEDLAALATRAMVSLGEASA
jgi:TPP-dependent pyruvate/acetoin dehydrogenase alpha subunit